MRRIKNINLPTPGCRNKIPKKPSDSHFLLNHVGGRVTGPKICSALWIQTSPDPRLFFRHLVFLHLPILCAKRRIQKCRHENKVLLFFKGTQKIYPGETNCCFCLSRKIWKCKACLFFSWFEKGLPYGFSQRKPRFSQLLWSKKKWNRNDFYQNYTFTSSELSPFLYWSNQPFSILTTLQPHHSIKTLNLIPQHPTQPSNYTRTNSSSTH